MNQKIQINYYENDIILTPSIISLAYEVRPKKVNVSVFAANTISWCKQQSAIYTTKMQLEEQIKEGWARIMKTITHLKETELIELLQTDEITKPYATSFDNMEILNNVPLNTILHDFRQKNKNLFESFAIYDKKQYLEQIKPFHSKTFKNQEFYSSL